MRATEVIETYIEDTVRLLPRKQRGDVAAELRTLLNEEMQTRAQESGQSPDETLALSLVRGYGRPNEAAARYQTPWAIIDPADSTSFLRAAIIGVFVLLVLGGLRSLRTAPLETTESQINIGILSWLGFLVVVFGIKNWLRRRNPASALWEPRDRDQVNRLGTALIVLVASFFVLLYAAPIWVLDIISRGRFETAWATYTDDFQRLRLPLFIGLEISLLALLSFVAIQGRWYRSTRRINIVLNLALACLVLLLAAEGNIFQSELVDRIARNVLGLIALIYVPCVGVMLYGEIGRIDRADPTPSSSNRRQM